MDVFVKAAPSASYRAGLVREAQEEKANLAADNVEAPPCQACGAPVKDADFEAHRAQVHGRPRQVFRPWGKPSSRELLISAPTPETLERKLAEWRTRNPGVRLLPLGQGKNTDTGLIWLRCRIATIFKERWARSEV